MVIENELKCLQKRIAFYSAYFEKLSIKLYFEKCKTFKTEYEQNENSLSILTTQVKLHKIETTLNYLINEFQESMVSYVEIMNTNTQIDKK